MGTPGDLDPSNDRDRDVTAITGSPDIATTKRHTPPFIVGTNGVYTIVVTNAGTATTVNSITVRDTLPAGFTYQGVAGPGWSVGQSGQVITATYTDPIAAGDSASFTITVGITAAAYPFVTNSATAEMAGDPNPANDVAYDPTPISGLQDVVIDKRHTSAFSVGQNATYTFVVTNTGTAATTNAVTVTDTLPAGLIYVGGAGAGWSFGQNGQEIVATNSGTIPAGDSLVFTLAVSVGAAAYPTVVNAAVVATPGDLDLGNNADADTASVAGAADVAIDKRHTAPFGVGANSAYLIVVTNAGTAPTANTITVTDTLPVGITYVSGVGAGWSFAQAGQEITATYTGAIAPADSAAFTLTVGVTAAAYPAVTNSGTVSMTGDLDAANNVDADPTTINGLYDLIIDKRHTAAFTVAQAGVYTLMVTNSGTAPTAGTITVTDTLPAGLTYVGGAGPGWSFAQAGQRVTATHPGPIAAGDSLGFLLTVSVGAAAYPAVTNSATVAIPGDLDAGNNTDTDVAPILGAPDVTLDKRHAAPFLVGQNGVYTFAVQNAGSAATFATTIVRDTLPTGLTYVSGAGAGWSFALFGQEVTATHAGAIVAGDSAVFTITAGVAQSAYPGVTNAATATTVGESDPNNGRDIDPTQVDGIADLNLDKRHTVPFTVGQNGSYSFTIRNVGTAPSSGTVTLRDTLPAGLTFVSGVGAGWSFSVAGQTVTMTRASAIGIGATVNLSMTVGVSAAAYPLVTNAATVSVPGDGNALNDRDVDPTIVNGASDLSLDKRHTAPFALGQNASYTIVVTNAGPTVTTGAATVSDTLPAGLTFVSASGAGWSISINGAIVTATHAAAIVAGDSASFQLTVAVGPAAFPAVTNAAQVATAGDPAAGNDYDVDPAVILGQPDLTIDKRHTSNFTAGQNGVYTLVVQNQGSGASAGIVTVTDTLPAGLAFLSGAGAGWSFAQNGSIVTATNPGAIAAGDSASFTLTVSVSAAAVPAVTNSAEVSGGGDALASNNRDSDPTVVNGVPDLAIDKRHTATFTAGGNGVYTLVVTNVGNGPTAGTLTVTDVLPAGLTFVGGAGGGWVVSASGATVTATFAGSIAAGDSASLALTVAVGAAAVPSVTNAAQVSGGGDVTPANDQDSDDATVIGLPDLTLDKRHTTTFDVGQNADYVLVVTNAGASATTSSVVVRDTLPAGLTYAGAAGSGWGFSVSGQIVTATHPAVIAAGDSAKLNLTVAVGAAAAPSVTNSATASGGGDVSPANNRDTDAATVGGAPDLALDKRHLNTFAVGNLGHYVLVVRNVGTAATTAAVTVRDTLPVGLTFSAATGGGWTFTTVGQTVIATFAALIAAGDSARFTLDVHVEDEALPSVTNTATASGGGDGSPANNFDSDGVTVFGLGQLVIEKTSSEHEVELGDVINYTVTVRNDGEGPVFSAEVLDVLPSGFRYLPGSARANGVATADPAGSPGPSLRFPVGTLGVSGAYAISYRVAIGAGAELGSGRNTAYASGLNAGNGAVASNTAVAAVHVRPGALADDGVIFGKLYADCDCDSNRTQGPEELGIPGVRVYLEDGRAAITDAEGKYHFNHVRPIMHVVRIDDATLPPGSRLVPISTRNGRDGLSRFVDLQKGELHRADFAEGSGQASVIEAIKARRAGGETNAAAGDGDEVLAGDATASTPRWSRTSLLAMGLLHGRVNLHSLKDIELGSAGRDRFEDELHDAVVTREEGKLEGRGRAALFARARMRDSIQLTVAYDSERDPERRLFSDIRPNEGYDLLGDASVHEFDTQSVGRLFARADRGPSYALYGDFATPSTSSRLLGAFSRQLNGGLLNVVAGPGQWGAFASQGHQRQVVDEFPGQGVSGPYALSRPDGTLGSERVEILVRDRNQPTRIIRRDAQVRFVEYTLEPFTGRLLFRRPVPSVDSDLNPVSIRVSYESASGGDPFWVFGASGRVTPNEYLSAGASISRDNDPLSPLDVVSLDATATFHDLLTVTAEAARSDSGGDILAGNSVGKAERLEGKLALGPFDAAAHALRTDINFRNPSSGTAPGREELGFGSHLRVGPSTALFANGIRSRDLKTLGNRDGLEGGLSQGLGPWLTAEGAYRWAQETAAPASATAAGTTPNDLSSVRGRLTAHLPLHWKTSAYGEFEQDLDVTDKHRAAFGGDVQLNAQTRLFARHENLTSFSGPYALNAQQQMATTVVGLSGDAKDRQIFSEYRMRDGLAGREAQAAMGLRNRWTVMEGLRLDGSLERISILAGPGGAATSATGAVEYTGAPLWKGTARLEVRRQSGQDRWLTSGGLTRKLSRDWAALGRTEWLLVPADERIESRSQFGMAFRETDRNRLSGLARYENRQERTGGALPVRKNTHIVASNANWQPLARLTFESQIAGKWSRDIHDGFTSRTRSGLVSGRTLLDLTSWLDAGVAGRARIAGTRTFGAGGELGVLLMRDLRVAGGYNIFGFRGEDLLGVDHTDRGPYIDFGFKFGHAAGVPERDTAGGKAP